MQVFFIIKKTEYLTYKISKLVQLPMLSGIVPVKLLSLTSLKIQEKHINNNKDIKHKSRNKIAPKRNLDRAGLDYSQVPQTG
jgi:hypothetical protein